MDLEDDDFIDSKNLKSKLQHLEPLKPLNLEGLKSSGLKPLKNLTTPINVFGGSEPSGKNEVSVDSSKVNKSPRSFYGSVSGRINPLHYKTRDMCKDYNSLMNSLYPRTEGSDGNEVSESLKSKVSSELEETSEEDPSKICNQKPSKENSEDLNLLGISELKERTEDLNLRMFCQELEMKHNIESKILCSLEPKAKDYDLEEAIIETLPYSKKKCVVWWEGETIPYNKFRENPEYILFFVGEDAYGYSKKCLYEEYIKESLGQRPGMQSLNRDTKNRVYFDLDLNWEDGEILWIPMSQILRILEFSHPVYELQKTKFSNKVWNAIPVKLQK